VTDLNAIAMALTPAGNDVLAERARQRAVEGFGDDHDNAQKRGELASAAMAYIQAAAFAARTGVTDLSYCPAPYYWPWHRSWWKPTTHRRVLVKAGALILAEIERIDRAADKGTKAR